MNKTQQSQVEEVQRLCKTVRGLMSTMSHLAYEKREVLASQKYCFSKRDVLHNILRLKQLTRDLTLGAEVMKADTDQSLSALEKHRMLVNNHEYEAKTLRKEAAALRHFRSAHPEVKLVSMEDFDRTHPDADANGAVDADGRRHKREIERHIFEEAERKKLVERRNVLEQAKRDRHTKADAEQKFLRTIDARFRKVVDASRSLDTFLASSPLAGDIDARVKELPHRLFVVYHAFVSAQQCHELSSDYKVCVDGSFDDAVTWNARFDTLTSPHEDSRGKATHEEDGPLLKRRRICPHEEPAKTPEQHIEARKREALEESKKREVLDVEQFDAKAGAASLVTTNGVGADAKAASASSNGASASSPIDIDEDEDGEVQVLDVSASSPLPPAKAKSPQQLPAVVASSSLSSPASTPLDTTFHPLSIHVKFPPLNGQSQQANAGARRLVFRYCCASRLVTAHVAGTGDAVLHHLFPHDAGIATRPAFSAVSNDGKLSEGVAYAWCQRLAGLQFPFERLAVPPSADCERSQTPFVDANEDDEQLAVDNNDEADGSSMYDEDEDMDDEDDPSAHLVASVSAAGSKRKYASMSSNTSRNEPAPRDSIALRSYPKIAVAQVCERIASRAIAREALKIQLQPLRHGNKLIFDTPNSQFPQRGKAIFEKIQMLTFQKYNEKFDADAQPDPHTAFYEVNLKRATTGLSMGIALSAEYPTRPPLFRLVYQSGRADSPAVDQLPGSVHPTAVEALRNGDDTFESSLLRIQNFINTRSHELVRAAVAHAKTSPAQYGSAVMKNVPLETSMANLVLSLQLRQAQVMYDEWQGARRSMKDFEVQVADQAPRRWRGRDHQMC